MTQTDLQNRLQTLYNCGISNPTTLQVQSGASRRSVFRYLKLLKSGKELTVQPRSGRPPLCDVNGRRRLTQIALQNPLKSAQQIQLRAEELGGPPLSERTVRRYLKKSGILKLVPKQALALTAEHKRKRVLFCDQHANDDFSSTFFSDECSFSFERMNCPRWSAGSPRRIPHNKFPKTVMVWGAISSRGQSTLAVINGTINQYSYQKTLEQHLLTRAEALYGENWRFQQDNARPHTAESTRNWLSENVPAQLEWPPNSADLSPIENVWPLLKNAAEKQQAKRFPDFRENLVKLWDDLDESMLSRLLDSVPRRLKACRDLRGEEINLKLI